MSGVAEEQAPQADNPGALISRLVSVAAVHCPCFSGRPFTYFPVLPTRLYPHRPPWHPSIQTLCPSSSLIGPGGWEESWGGVHG